MKIDLSLANSPAQKPEFKTRIPFEVSSSADVASVLPSDYKTKAVDSLLPYIDYEKNPDIMGVSFHGAVVNQFNKNDDGISTQAALALASRFLNKPTNIEHNETEIVGHIVSYGFTDMETGEELYEYELQNKEDPFYMTFGAVVYKSIYPELASLLQQKSSPIKASWEIGFNQFDVGVGEHANIANVNIIREPTQVEGMRKYLAAYKGNGRTEDGERVRRIIKGEIYGLAMGFTTNPAAKVPSAHADKNSKTITVYRKNKEKFSQSSIINVKSNKMNPELKQVLDELRNLLPQSEDSEKTVASISQALRDGIQNANTEWLEKLNAEKKAKEEAQNKLTNFESTLAEIQGKLEDAEKRISEFEAAEAAARAVESFNSRMEEVSNEYELDDDDSKYLAGKLKTITTDEAFASFKDELSVLWKHKSVSSKEAREKAFDEQVQKAVAAKLGHKEKVEPKEALEKAKTEDGKIPNADGSEKETLREKFGKALSRENITIS